MARADRETSLDLVQFGATGFAGRLTAEYLAEHAPPGLRWALAGRNRAKLEAVRDAVAALAPDRPAPEVIEVALDDAPALDALAARTKVILTTIGPYALHGEPLVAAAAKAGADYVDITGEPQFVDAMYLRYHEVAVASGARLIHCAGFDSVPHDLGAYFTVKQLPADAPIAVVGAVRANAEFSGGTYQSAINGFAAMGEMTRLSRERRTQEQAARSSDERRTAKPVTGPPRRDELTGRWLAPLPTIDPQIVVRSAAALPAYGPSFTYEHTLSAKRLTTILALGTGAALLLPAARIGPVRKALLKVRSSGGGPDEARRARSWFKVRFTGTGSGKRVVTEVRGGDPGYDETAKMVAETALACIYDADAPDVSGQTTTAAALGEQLLTRLTAAGIEFEVLQTDEVAA